MRELLRRLWLFLTSWLSGPPSVPDPVLPPPVPVYPYGAVPTALSHYSLLGSLATQMTMAFPGSLVENIFPENYEDSVSSSVDMGKGLRVEFMSSATLSADGYGIRVCGRVRMTLVGESITQVVLDVGTVSPNSPITAVEWVASMLEAKMLSLGMRAVSLDMKELDAAANKAYRDSLLHCVAAFASSFVHRVDYQDVLDIWKNEEIRFVMKR